MDVFCLVRFEAFASCFPCSGIATLSGFLHRVPPLPFPLDLSFLVLVFFFLLASQLSFFAPSVLRLGSFLFRLFLASLSFLALADHVIKGTVDVDRIFNAHFGEGEEGRAVRMFRVRWLFRWMNGRMGSIDVVCQVVVVLDGYGREII